MHMLTASTTAISAAFAPKRIDDQFRKGNPRAKLTGPSNVRICRQPQPLSKFKLSLQTQLRPDRTKPIRRAMRMHSASSTCTASLDAKCAAVQTRPETRRGKASTYAPLKDDTNKSPALDNGGAGLPPRDDGGGGGGGGGGHWSGGFFLFAFLAFLAMLKDKEDESDYEEYPKKRSAQF